MAAELVVIGAGGFGRETLDVIEAVNAAGERLFEVVGVVDDNPSGMNIERLHARGYEHLGGVEEVLRSRAPGAYVLGVGSPNAKQTLAGVFDSTGWEPTTVVHPTATIGTQTVLDAGTVVCAGVQLSTNVRLGKHVHLNPGVIIGHDAILDDFVSVNPGAIVSGEVKVGSGVLVGAGAVVLQRLTIGTGTVIGAAACVTRTPVPGHTIVGVPAQPLVKPAAESERA
ncbi:NeuD/PglB/VioB family sugar acetyltransferase [Sediminivirga luteola]|uniref:Acetyltransferase n=1 Tax=Sediminivirga luteola TaxID=1774748 RepID=A0A8J2TWW7_9MICO|nr:NeuD/PglB/VioB family sugar acetyltransferase [Sediminivirga luteola]GGA09622.1 acetyltransferase [Sediminivirga luteola]